MIKFPTPEEKNKIQQDIIKGIKNLPAYPDVILRAKRLIKSEKAGIGEISQILLKDPALAARVLKLANSAFYQVKGGVGSIKYAAQILGLQTLIEIIEAAALSELFSKNLQPYDISPENLWRHSLFVAFSAKKICTLYYQEYEADAFTAGLLHDCGKILLSPWLNKYSHTFDDLIFRNFEVNDAESKIIGINHSQVGYAMMKLWRLPPHIQSSIRLHHTRNFTTDEKFSIILSMANLMSFSSLEEGLMTPGHFESINAVSDNINIDINKIIEISSQAYEFTEEISSGIL